MTDNSLTFNPDAGAITAYAASAAAYAREAVSGNTLRAYGAAWREFQAFAEGRSVAALPADPATVIAYIAALADAGAKVSTIRLKLAAISFQHTQHHAIDPTQGADVRLVARGIRRKIGTAPHKKAAITLADLRAMVAALPDTLAGKRDRAILLVGFAGAFRRSELAGLDVADLRINGVIKITIKRSKTDQEGQGKVKVIPPIDDEGIDPVRALRAWLAESGIKAGPIFRPISKGGAMRDAGLSDKAIALIVKAAAQRVGLEPGEFAGHSLRSGFITAASLAGVVDRDIAAQSGHESMTVLHGYIQDSGAAQVRAARAAFGEK